MTMTDAMEARQQHIEIITVPEAHAHILVQQMHRGALFLANARQETRAARTDAIMILQGLIVATVENATATATVIIFALEANPAASVYMINAGIAQVGMEPIAALVIQALIVA